MTANPPTERRAIGAPAMAAGIFLIALAVAAAAAAFLDRSGPVTGALLRAREGPSADHWLGTDQLGRDELSRLLAGARVSLLAAIEAVGIAVVVGVPLGLVAGYRGGWWDRCTIRITEVVLCIPAVVVAIALVGAVGPGVEISMLAVGLVFAARMLRLVRGEVLSAREAAYVDAARVSGSGDARIVGHHILPNLLPVIVVQATVLFAAAVLAEATLSFLGLGVAPPTASWGVMLDQARDELGRAPLLAVWPGIAIFLAVLAFNVLGDGLRNRYGTPANPGALSASGIARVGATKLARVPDGTVALAVRKLTVSVPASTEPMDVVSGVSFEVAPGEVVGLVGESGSGKSTTALGILGLVPAPGRVEAESIVVVGTELVGASFDDLRRVRGRHVGMVAQEPWASLNPAYPILRQVAEPLRWHFKLSRREAERGGTAMLERVGISSSRRACYPHQLSGGEAQRVALAMALVAEPEVLIADEPTTALDAVVQRDILDLIQALQRERDIGVLLISHDLAVVSALADRVAVMYAGELVETASTPELLRHPRHPYTAGLIDSVPRNESRQGDLRVIPGRMPPPGEWPTGCRFADRCAYETAVCAHPIPLVRTETGGAVRCVRNGSLRLRGVETMPSGRSTCAPM